jgi:hypothetical protein
MACSEYVPGPEITRQTSRAFGGESLGIHVGPAHVLLEGITRAQRDTLTDRYSVFARPARPDEAFSLKVRVGSAPRPTFLICHSTIEKPEFYRIVTSWHGDLLQATSYEWSGWMDRTAGTGGLILAELALADPTAFDRAVENFLRVVCAHLVIPAGGFVLHGACLVLDARAYLFFGPSGSGKTTVTSMTPEALVVSDDLALILRGNDGAPHACSVPFRGLFHPRYTTVRTYPVAGFFRLIQSPDDFLEPLSGAWAVGELVGSLPFVTDRAEMMGEALDTVAQAAARAGVWRLNFTRSRAFWKTLSDAGLSRPVDSFSTDRGMKA